MAMAGRAIPTKALNCLCTNLTGTLHGFTVLRVSKATMTLAGTADLALLTNMDSPYSLLNTNRKQFLVLRKREQGFVLGEQSHHLLHRNTNVNKEADVENGVYDRPSSLGDAI